MSIILYAIRSFVGTSDALFKHDYFTRNMIHKKSNGLKRLIVRKYQTIFIDNDLMSISNVKPKE